jgi:hypothetical protein
LIAIIDNWIALAHRASAAARALSRRRIDPMWRKVLLGVAVMVLIDQTTYGTFAKGVGPSITISEDAKV